jgi:hypothetical protein
MHDPLPGMVFSEKETTMPAERKDTPASLDRYSTTGPVTVTGTMKGVCELKQRGK